MKKILTLFKYMAGGAFSPKHLIASFKEDKKKALKKSGVVILLLCCLTPSYVMYVGAISAFYDVFASMNQASAVVAVALVLVSAMCLFFGMMYIFAGFFASRDIETMLSLPVKPKEIVAAKLLYAVVYEYIVSMPMILPIFVIIGLKTAFTATYVLYSIIISLLLPVIPVAIAAVFELLVIRIFGMKVNVEKVQSIFQLVFVGIILYITFAMQNSALSSATGDISEMINNLISDKMYLLTDAVRNYFPAYLAAMGVSLSGEVLGFVYTLGFTALSAAAFAVSVFVSDKVYITSVTNQPVNAVSGKTKVLSREERAKQSGKIKKPFMAVFAYDLKTILRNQVFWFNTLFIIIVMPLCMIVPIAMQLGGSAASEIAGFLNNIRASYASILGPAATLVIVFATGFCVSMAGFTASTFSREGRAFWTNQVLPIRALDQLIGRSLLGVILSALVSLMLGILCFFILGISPLYVVLGCILSALMVMPNLSLGIMFDTVHPITNWDNPVKAVKQNTNVLFTMFITMAMLALGGYAAVLISTGYSFTLGLVFCTLYPVVLSAPFVWWFLKNFNKKIMEK